VASTRLRLTSRIRRRSPCYRKATCSGVSRKAGSVSRSKACRGNPPCLVGKSSCRMNGFGKLSWVNTTARINRQERGNEAELRTRNEARMIRGMYQQMRWSGAIAGLGAAWLVAGATIAMAQESVAVPGSMVKGAIPADDPNAAAWNSAPLSEFPLSPQVHWQNRIQEATVKDLKIRALHDGTQLAILLEYADPTEDPDDAAALEFMVGDKKAHFAHGQPMAQVEGGPVN